MVWELMLSDFLLLVVIWVFFSANQIRWRLLQQQAEYFLYYCYFYSLIVMIFLKYGSGKCVSSTF